MTERCKRTVHWYGLDATYRCRRREGHPGHHHDGLFVFDDLGIRVDGTDHAQTLAEPGTPAAWARPSYARLTVAEVYEIRQRYADGESFASIARHVHREAPTVRNCALRNTYRHVDDAREAGAA